MQQFKKKKHTQNVPHDNRWMNVFTDTLNKVNNVIWTLLVISTRRCSSGVHAGVDTLQRLHGGQC